MKRDDDQVSWQEKDTAELYESISVTAEDKGATQAFLRRVNVERGRHRMLGQEGNTGGLYEAVDQLCISYQGLSHPHAARLTIEKKKQVVLCCVIMPFWGAERKKTGKRKKEEEERNIGRKHSPPHPKSSSITSHCRIKIFPDAFHFLCLFVFLHPILPHRFRVNV